MCWKTWIYVDYLNLYCPSFTKFNIQHHNNNFKYNKRSTTDWKFYRSPIEYQMFTTFARFSIICITRMLPEFSSTSMYLRTTEICKPDNANKKN